MWRTLEQIIYSSTSFVFFIIVGKKFDAIVLDRFTVFYTLMMILLTLSTEWIILPVTSYNKSLSVTESLHVGLSRICVVCLLGLVIIPAYAFYLSLDLSFFIFGLYFASVSWLILEFLRCQLIVLEQFKFSFILVTGKWAIMLSGLYLFDSVYSYFSYISIMLFAISCIGLYILFVLEGVSLLSIDLMQGDRALIQNSALNVLQGAAVIKVFGIHPGYLGVYFVLRSLGNVFNPVFSVIETHFGHKDLLKVFRAHSKYFGLGGILVGSGLYFTIVYAHDILSFLYSGEIAKYSEVLGYVAGLICLQNIYRLIQVVIRERHILRVFSVQRTMNMLVLIILSLLAYFSFSFPMLPLVVLIGYYALMIFIAIYYVRETIVKSGP